MAKHQWSLLCRRSIVDKDTNSISLIDVVESYTLEAGASVKIREQLANLKESEGVLLPLVVEVVSSWIRSDATTPESGNARLQIKSPEGRVLASAEFEINLKESFRFRQKIVFSNFLHVGAGVYTFLIQQKSSTKKASRWVSENELLLDCIEKET